jgi:hypothetical protein
MATVTVTLIRGGQVQKIPTLFVRNPDDRRYVLDEVTPGCEWVLAGEGIATRKYDGTCVKADANGNWWARREVKPGKIPPPNFLAIKTDPETGKTIGWEPAEQSPFAKYLKEAANGDNWETGTYELCGPKINGNPENFEHHELIDHRDATRILVNCATPELIRLTVIELGKQGIEGIVWHASGGRMAKLKGRDFPNP